MKLLSIVLRLELVISCLIAYRIPFKFRNQNSLVYNRARLHEVTSANEGNSVKTSELLSLDSIRSTLIRQEETIIFALIERAQFRRNYCIYDPKHVKLRNVYGSPLSFLEWMLLETEKLHALVRRYTSPEEHPFYETQLPEPILPALEFPTLLSVRKSDVDVNPEIMRWYVEKIIDRLCLPGDDEQHGSSTLCDITVLQAISRRVHYGKFVAESKFIADPDEFRKLVEQKRVLEVLQKLTKKDVERTVLRRAFIKAYQYGQDVTATMTGVQQGSRKIDPKLISDIYRDMIIPLTKVVEVRYIYHRIGAEPPAPDTYFTHCRAPLDAFDDKSIFNKFGLDLDSLKFSKPEINILNDVSSEITKK